MAESMMDKSMPPLGQPIMDEEDQDIIVEEEEGEIEEDPNALPRVIIEGQDITEELTQELLTDFDANLAELLEEKELTDIGLSLFSDSETGKQKWINTSSYRVREIYRNNALTREHEILEIFKKSKVDHANISVQGGYIKPLMNLFNKR